MTRRMSAILGEYSPAGQGCTRHFSVPPLEYKNSTSYKKYRPNFGLNIQESYGKRPISSQRTRGLRGSERTHESDQNNHSVRAGDGRYGEKGSQEKDIYLGAVSSCVGGSVGVLC